LSSNFSAELSPTRNKNVKSPKMVFEFNVEGPIVYGFQIVV
jgi:hypothetical protein